MSQQELHIGVLSGSRGWHLQDLERAASECPSVEIHDLDHRDLSARVEQSGTCVASGEVLLDELDAVFVRAMPLGSLEQVVFRMDLLHRLEERGVLVVNSARAIECAVDKYLALARLAAAGLAVPATRVSERAAEAIEDFEALGGDVVVKPLFGSEGRGLMRLSDPELATRCFSTLERLGAVIYQQVYVDHPGWDIRALVIGERVVAAMRRWAPERSGVTDWRTNISCGGRAETHDCDPAEHSLALATARAVGTEIAGVDILPTPDGGLNVIEVNSAPGWRGLTKATGVDVAREILDHLVKLRIAGRAP